jgi:hypothetical protein
MNQGTMWVLLMKRKPEVKKCHASLYFDVGQAITLFGAGSQRFAVQYVFSLARAGNIIFRRFSHFLRL